LSSAPVACRLAQTSLERVLGTIIGGLCGFAVCWLADPVPKKWEWTVYSFLAASFGWVAVWMGHRLALNYSFKLAVITFILVFAGADDLVRPRACMGTSLMLRPYAHGVRCACAPDRPVIQARAS
jgi:uncharacterized membrane protein YccC